MLTEMKKFVLKLDLSNDKEKRKAMKTVSAVSGVDEISIDMKGKTLTVIGTVDPIRVVSKLRKFWPTDIILMGPAKEATEEGEEPKKDETTNDEEKKEDAKKEEETKKEEAKKVEPEPAVGTVLPYRPYYPPMNTYYYVNHSM